MSEAAKLKQLELLQTRLGIHGGRLWQLPFSYAGVVAISASLLKEGDLVIPYQNVFLALSMAGVIVAACMFGAYEAYRRTARNLRAAEAELSLVPYTHNSFGHCVPYCVLVAFVTVLTLHLGIISTEPDHWQWLRFGLPAAGRE